MTSRYERRLAVVEPAPSVTPELVAREIVREAVGWLALLAFGWWIVRHPLRLAGSIAAIGVAWMLWPLAVAGFGVVFAGATIAHHRRSYGPLRLAAAVAGVLALIGGAFLLAAVLALGAAAPMIERQARRFGA